MRYHIGLFTLISIVGLVSIGFAQEAATTLEDSSVIMPTVTVAETPAYPYMAEITGNDVNIRAGAGTIYYSCGKLYKGDKVTIIGDRDGVWSQILPLPDSFSWISSQYVKIDPDDQTIGEVTGDSVRVYAGSDVVRPENSPTQHGKLNKGDKVRLLGEQLNEYYKIAVPSLPDAYFWVSTQYTKPIAPEEPETETVTETPGVGAEVITPESDAPDSIDVSENIIVNPEDGIQEIPTVPETPLEKYYELSDQIEVEKAKSFEEQDYSSIKEALQEIADNKESGKAGSYAKAQIERIEGFELALEVEKVVKLQNEQLQKTKEKIKTAHTMRLEEVQNLGKYAVIGKLQNFLTLGSGHYRIVDESDQTICYAIPSEKASSMDISNFIGKKVGLTGSIEANTQTAGAMVRFNNVDILE